MDGRTPARAAIWQNPFRMLGFEDAFHQIVITDITTVDLQSSFLRIGLLEKPEIGFLDLHIVIVIHFVDNDHIITSGEKVIGYVAADESCSTCYQYFFVPNVGLDGCVSRAVSRLFDLGEHDRTPRSVHGSYCFVGNTVSWSGVIRT